MLNPQNINISNTDLKRILTAVGGPVLTIDDLEITRDDILELVVLPALEAHFSYFPIERVQELAMAGTISVPFPDPDLTLGVCSAQVSMDVGTTSNPSLSPFINDRNYQRGGLLRQGQYDIEAIDGNLMTRMAAQGAINLLATKHLRVNRQLKILEGFSNSSAICRIIWAMFSLDVEDVLIEQKVNFIRLCQANILEVLGTIRGAVSLSDDVAMPGDAMIERAQTIREDVLETWRSVTRVVVVRG